jgi:hypothetical protein
MPAYLRNWHHYMNPLSDQAANSPERSRLLNKAISRWDNEGGAGIEGNYPAASVELLTDALPLTNAELVQLQIRVIALENMLAVLMADASDRQLKLVREIADCITPQPGFTPHPLTIHAAARMLGFIERSGHLRTLQFEDANVGDSANGGLDVGCANWA